MSNPNESVYQGKTGRVVNLLLFSLAGISLCFVSIYLLTQLHFARVNKLSDDLSEPEKPADENVVPSETFHFHEPWVIVPDEDTTESIDLKEVDETEFHIPEVGFRWPELIPQSEDEEDHDFHTNDVPSER